jgi:hypothetical protein
MRQPVARVTRREGPHIQHRIALTDGAEALPQQVVTHLPAYTLIIEIIHATELYQIPSPVHAGVLPDVARGERRS